MLPCWGGLCAQYSEKDFTLFSTTGGLTNNDINSIAQDSKGYIWIATDNGLNRFDGTKFTGYFADDKMVPLTHDRIYRVKNIGNEELAIITRNGNFILNTRTYQSKLLTVPDSTNLQDLVNSGWDVLRMSDGNIALTTATGFYVFNAEGKLLYRYDHFTAKDRATKRILFGREMYPLNNGEVLVNCLADSLRLAVYNIKQKQFRISRRNDKMYSLFFEPPPTLGDQWISKIDIGDNKFLMLPGYPGKGIVYYDFKTGKKVISLLPEEYLRNLSWRSSFTQLSDSTFALSLGRILKGFCTLHLDRATGKLSLNATRFLTDYYITTMFLDKEKRLWVGTDKGMLMQKLKTPVIRSTTFNFSTPDSTMQMITCAYRAGNRLFIGNANKHRGLLIADAATMKPIKLMGFYGDNNMYSQIHAIQPVHADTLWLDTEEGLLWLNIKNYHYGKVLPEFFDGGHASLQPPDEMGNVWVIGKGLRMSKYNPVSRSWTHYSYKTAPRLPFNNVKQIVHDVYGDTWFGGHGLVRLDSRSQRFDTIVYPYAGKQKYDDDIVAIVADGSGNLWIHNAHNGLLQYIIKEKRFVSYTMRDGLPSNSIDALSADIDGRIWLLTTKSIANIDIRTKKIKAFGIADGFKILPSFTRSMYFDKDSSVLYYFTDNTISRIELPEDARKSFFQGFSLRSLVTNTGLELYDIPDSITLHRGTQSINFGFGVVDFEEGNHYTYSYKINNGDWVDLGTNNTLLLNGLKPGVFVINFRALGNDGVYHNQHSRIFIKFPFWERAWFYWLVAAAGALLIVAYIRFRINRIKHKAKIEKEIALLEMKALHAQMNPHFVFNSLNSIREMVLYNENDDASHYLAKFGQLLRFTLNQSVKTFVPLRETIEYLQRYIELEQARNNLFTTQILADDNVDHDNVFLPPMLIQPLIENAIWHGITSSKRNINIKVHFGINNNQLICTIEDDGIGIEKSIAKKAAGARVHNSVGIENVKNRIRILKEKYKLESSISIEDKSNLPGSAGTGTIVRIYLPLNIKLSTI